MSQIVDGVEYTARDIADMVRDNRFYLFTQRYQREDRTNDETFVFHESFEQLLGLIGKETKRYCWDDWEIDWTVLDNKVIECTIGEIYATTTLKTSKLDSQQLAQVEALLKQRKEWTREECDCEDCQFVSDDEGAECSCDDCKQHLEKAE